MDDWRSQHIPGQWEQWLEWCYAGKITGIFLDPMFGSQRQWIDPPRGEHIATFARPEQHGDPVCLLDVSRKKVADTGKLYQFCGTGATAIHLAYLMGADEVTLVGLDGADGNATILNEHYKDCPRSGKANYGLARKSALFAASRLRLTAVDYMEVDDGEV